VSARPGTRRWLRASLVAGAVVGLATLARADAPSDQYEFFDLTTTVIQDLRTGLYWQRYPPATGVSFAGAAAYCASLVPDGGGPAWRVPSYKELLTLVDESPHTEYTGGQLQQKAIDGNAFPQIPVDLSYVTSSVYPGTPSGYVYTVDFHNGLPGAADATQSFYVRCVY